MPLLQETAVFNIVAKSRQINILLPLLPCFVMQVCLVATVV